jgi:neutral ceramidase
MSARGWQAGVATTVITPQEPMWLAGWAARRQPATRAAMELFAKAIAFEDPAGERVVIVTADLIAIPRTLADLVVKRLQRGGLKIPRGRFLFNASHTHTGPEVRPDKVPFFEIPDKFAAKIPSYVRELEQKLAVLIEEALGKLEPATLRLDQTSVAFAVNRRAAAGAIDHNVPVMSVTRPDGTPLAILFGYACHNLTLPPTFCEFHGDYAGVAQQNLEKRHPGATALFLAGAGADQDPAPRGTPELCAQHGGVLAEAVGEASSASLDGDAAPTPRWAKSPRRGRRSSILQPRLRVAFEQIALDLQPLPPIEALQSDVQSDDLPRRRKAEFLLAALAENRPLSTTQLCPVQVLRFGNELTLIALGGEPVVDYALQFKREFSGPLVWVAGYSNDMFGYVPTLRVQQEGGYEGGRAALWSALPMPVAENTEERVVAAVRRLVANVARASRP